MPHSIANQLKNILLVSFSLPSRQQVSQALLSLGLNQFMVANNASEGLRLFRLPSYEAELVLLVAGNGKTGEVIAFLEEIHHQNPQAYVILVLAGDAGHRLTEFVNAGINGIISLPDLEKDLENQLRKAALEINRLNHFQAMMHRFEDPMTKLPNQQKLHKDIQPDQSYHLLIVNADDFRGVNELYGHQMGDQLSQAIAQRIHRFVQHTGFSLYKLQVDEFGILVPHRYQRMNYLDLATSLMNDLTETPFAINGHQIFVNFSMGIASTETGQTHLIRHAGVALASAKRSKSGHAFYHTQLEDERQYHSLTWLTKIRHALDNDGILLYFQPIHNNHSGRVDRFEALVRLRDEENVIHSPASFLDHAKQLKMYERITRSVLDQALALIRDHQCPLSINLSVEDILGKRTRNFILSRLLQERKIAPLLGFELTESESITNYEELGAFIDKVKRYGSTFSIDDFGSGYSNYINLLKLNISCLKIDGSIIENILTDHHSSELLRSIIGLSKKLNLKTIAEFVSNEQLQHEVAQFGVDLSQGYYIGKPMDKSQFLLFLRENRIEQHADES